MYTVPPKLLADTERALTTRPPAMAQDGTFAEFIRRIRAGDAQAAEELVRRYESVIRVEVRHRLSDPRLRRLFDSMDISQSVLASFFVRASTGQYELDEPAQLVKLLVGMARNKLAFQARKQRALRRDHRRVETLDPESCDVPASDPSPSQEIAHRELLETFRQRLSAEERHLADLRAQGRGWAEIVAALGGTAQGRRKQLARAIDRVAKELGLDEGSYD
jgi:DNA-directed RNA polymerase specialized sigma24 family protein